MSDVTFVSYAPNGEDVVLWRALRDISGGRYVDVGASHPVHNSITKAFYDRGWRGANIHAAVTSADVSEIGWREMPDSGPSTVVDSAARSHGATGPPVLDVTAPTLRLDDVLAKYVGPDEPVHFLRIDVEGVEAGALATLDLRTWRPWVLVVEATAPNSTEPTPKGWEPAVLASGYQFCLFDGVSRFYLADEHPELAVALSYPACVLDSFTRYSELHVAEQRDEAVADLVRWRGLAMQAWAHAPARREDLTRLTADVQQLREAAAHAGHAAAIAHDELVRIRQTLSWRVTKPLRAARRINPSVGA